MCDLTKLRKEVEELEREFAEKLNSIECKYHVSVNEIGVGKVDVSTPIGGHKTVVLVDISISLK